MVLISSGGDGSHLTAYGRQPKALIQSIRVNADGVSVCRAGDGDAQRHHGDL